MRKKGARVLFVQTAKYTTQKWLKILPFLTWSNVLSLNSHRSIALNKNSFSHIADIRHNDVKGHKKFNNCWREILLDLARLFIIKNDDNLLEMNPHILIYLARIEKVCQNNFESLVYWKGNSRASYPNDLIISALWTLCPKQFEPIFVLSNSYTKSLWVN